MNNVTNLCNCITGIQTNDRIFSKEFNSQCDRKIIKMNPVQISHKVIQLLSDQLSERQLKPVSSKLVRKSPDKFAAALVHEIRNPLTNINLAVEILKSELNDESREMYLDILLRSASRINIAVTDLLNYFQADEIEFENHPIQQLLDAALEVAEDRIMLKGITVTKDYPLQDSMAYVNKQVIIIAITNIIINAIEAMPLGKGQLKLTTKTVNNRPVIKIEDNGIGINKENLQNIFNPYYTKKAGGMGLGLSTTMKIMLANKAQLAVQSEVDKGTLFIITFNGNKMPELC